MAGVTSQTGTTRKLISVVWVLNIMLIVQASDPQFNETCSQTTQCQTGLICTNSSKCDCNDTEYYDPSSTKCKAKIQHDQTCSTTMPCQTGLICTNNNKCGCSDTEYYDPSSTSCKTKIQHDQTCSTTMQCQTGLICTNNNKCGCSDTEYYDPSSTSCKTKIQHNQTCNTTMPCQTGLICNNTKCVCKDTEYYDPSFTSCKTKTSSNSTLSVTSTTMASTTKAPEIQHDQTCSTTMQCQTGLICTNNNKCGCSDTEYYDPSSTSCKTKIQHNQTCNTTMPCQTGLICNNTKCVCKDTEYYDPSFTSCKTKTSSNSTLSVTSTTMASTTKAPEIQHDQTCSTTMQCQTGLICTNNNKCGCSDTEYYDPSSTSCKTKIQHNQTCNTTMPCQTGLICNNTKCVCKDTEYYDPSFTSCKTKTSSNSTLSVTSTTMASTTKAPEFNEACSQTMPCQTGLICTISSKCVCMDTEYYDPSSTKCKTKIQYNQTCITTMLCQTGLICTNNNKCGCNDTDYYDPSSTNCKTKIQHNQTCNTTMPCQTGLICNNTKCVCKDTEYYDPSLTSCKTKISYDQPCSSTMPCQADLICKTSNNKCGCLDTEYYDSTSSTDMCKTKILYDQPCSSTMPCQADLICKTSNNKCGCMDTDYYDSTSSTDMCKTKISYDQPCSSTMPCQADLICKTSNNKCGCMDTEYYDSTSSTDMCKTKISYDQLCSSTMPCQADLICKTSNNKCGCLDTDYYDSTSSTDMCKTKISYDQPCNSAMLCQADLICNSSTNKCGCMDTEYYDSTSSTDMCKTKINYNESCDGINSPNACSEQFTICTEYTGGTKKCLCDNTYYRTDNSSCSSQDKLKVQFTAKTRSTQFIVFTWNDTSGRNNINNTIMWSGNSVLATKTGGNVTGLTPGTPYNFSVVSTLPSDSNYGLITVFSMPNLQWTYPAKPGSVTGQNLSSDSTSKPFSYKVSFGKPDGNVVRCNVTITDTENINAPGCRETTASFTVNCQLEPARQYNYTIICYNGNSDPDQSEPSTGSFFTQPEGSGPVRNLNYTGVLENSANITWHKPSDPNGNIIGYLVEVKQQENDECVYNIKVSCQQQILGAVDSSCRDTETESDVCGEQYIFAVSRLSPYHNYTIVVKAVTELGLGIPKNISLRTDIGAANSIKTLSPNSARDENSHQVNLNISWQPGEYTGPTTYYILVEKETGLGTNMYNESSQHSVTDYYRTTFGLSDVLAYWNYKISVTAGTSKGNSSRMEAQFRTAANRPGFVQNLQVLQDAAVAKKLSLTFFCPEEQNRNGTIESFVINQTLLDSSNGTIYKVSNEDLSCKIMYSVPVTEISVEKNYSFSVKTINSYSEGEFGKSVSVFIYSKVPQLEVSMKNLGVDELIKKVNGNEETKITVDVCSKCLLDDRQGTVTNVGILVCIKGLSCPENSGRTRRAVFTNEDYNKFHTWGSAKIKDFKEKYRTTPNDWKETLKGDSVYSTYIIGGNTSCSDTSVASEYCNGPLPSGNKFMVTIVVCTEAGCAVHDDEFVASSNEGSPVGAIVGGVLGGLGVVAVVCVIIIVCRKAASRRENSSEPQENNLDVRRSTITSGNRYGHANTTREHFSLPQLDEDKHVYAEVSDYDYIEIESMNSHQQSHSPARTSQEELFNSVEGARKYFFPYENVVTVNYKQDK